MTDAEMTSMASRTVQLLAPVETPTGHGGCHSRPGAAGETSDKPVHGAPAQLFEDATRIFKGLGASSNKGSGLHCCGLGGKMFGGSLWLSRPGRRLTRIPVHVMLVVIAVACVVAIMPILLRQFRQLNEFLDHIQHKTNNTVYLQTDFEYWREAALNVSSLTVAGTTLHDCPFCSFDGSQMGDAVCDPLWDDSSPKCNINSMHNGVCSSKKGYGCNIAACAWSGGQCGCSVEQAGGCTKTWNYHDFFYGRQETSQWALLGSLLSFAWSLLSAGYLIWSLRLSLIVERRWQGRGSVEGLCYNAICNSRPAEVMVSYSWLDNKFLSRKLAQRLARLGYSVWLDVVCLVPGEDVTAQCLQAARAVKTSVIVWGASYKRSGICKQELALLAPNAKQGTARPFFWAQANKIGDRGSGGQDRADESPTPIQFHAKHELCDVHSSSRALDAFFLGKVSHAQPSFEPANLRMCSRNERGSTEHLVNIISAGEAEDPAIFPRPFSRWHAYCGYAAVLVGPQMIFLLLLELPGSLYAFHFVHMWQAPFTYFVLCLAIALFLVRFPRVSVHWAHYLSKARIESPLVMAVLCLLRYKGCAPIRVFRCFEKNRANEIRMESVFNRFVINLFHAFDRKELPPTISIVAVDKEYVRTCSSAELEKLLTVAKGGLAIVIALTSERDIGKAFDYGWTSHANTSAGSARVFLPSSRKNLLSSLRTVSTMLHMSSDDMDDDQNSPAAEENLKLEGWMCEHALAKLSNYGYYEILEVDSGQRRLSGWPLATGKDQGLPSIVLGRRFATGADGSILYQENGAARFHEQDHFCPGLDDPRVVTLSIETHAKIRIFKQLILNINEMNEWSDELAPIIGKNLKKILQHVHAGEQETHHGSAAKWSKLHGKSNKKQDASDAQMFKKSAEQIAAEALVEQLL